MIPDSPDVVLRPKQKAVLFRAMRRTMSEVERIMQRFIAQELVHMDDVACDRFSELLNQSDADLWDWLTGIKTPPVSVNREDLHRLERYRRE
ncbi:MAG: succinate dehydrogenase assembly factor 2 [Nitrospirae bacterium]|nr:succinate dehydrogenase assembly factor 2 [Magnetococcales bacterium]